MGRFDFEKISKLKLCSLSPANTKIKSIIDVQHQYACSVVGKSLHQNDVYI